MTRLIRLLQSHNIARSGLISLGGSVVGSLSSFVLVAVVTRSMHLAQAGLLFQAVGVVTVASAVVGWGVPAGLMRFTAREPRRGSSSTWSYFAIGTVPVVLLGAAVAVGLAVSAPTLAHILTSSDLTHEMSLLLRLLAPTVPLTVLTRCAVSTARGLGKSLPQALYNTGGMSTLRLLLCCLLSAVGASVWTYALCWSVAATACAIGSMLNLLRAGMQRPGHLSLSQIKEFWSFTLPRGAEVVLQTSSTWLLVVLVGAITTPDQAALYTAVSRSAVAVTFVLQATIFALGPRFSRLFAANDLASAQLLYRLSTEWLIALSIPTAAILAFFPGDFLSIFSQQYSSDGVAPMIVLSCAMMINLGTGPVGAVILMAGRSIWNLQNAAFGIFAAIIITATLVPSSGALGAAAAWAAYIVIQNGLGLWQIRRNFKMWPIGATSVRDIAATALVGTILKVVLVGADLGVAADLVIALISMLLLSVLLVAPRAIRQSRPASVEHANF